MLTEMAKKDFAGMVKVKVFKMGRSTWIIRVGTKCRQMYPYKGKAAGVWTTEEGYVTVRQSWVMQSS